MLGRLYVIFSHNFLALYDLLFQSLGVYVTEHNQEVVDQRDIVVIAVKPNVVPTVLNEVAPIITPDSLIVSLAAGVTLDSMERVCACHTPFSFIF